MLLTSWKIEFLEVQNLSMLSQSINMTMSEELLRFFAVNDSFLTIFSWKKLVETLIPKTELYDGEAHFLLISGCCALLNYSTALNAR